MPSSPFGPKYHTPSHDAYEGQLGPLTSAPQANERELRELEDYLRMQLAEVRMRLALLRPSR
jgi:hypothetical protein